MLITNKVIALISLFTAAFAAVYCLIPYFISFAVRRGYVDKPNARKVHKKPIPRIGGVSFSTIVILIFSVWLFFAFDAKSFSVLCGLILIFITGVVDDIKEMRARVKFFIQIAAAFMITSSGIRMTDLWGLFGIHELNIFSQYVISIVMIVGITNSFNLIDGIDGLASGVGLFNSVVLGALAVMEQNGALAVVNFSLAGGLLAFLIFNYNPARIFMGDSGSTVIGFIMGVSGVWLVSGHEYVYDMNVPVILFGILMLPVFDTLRIFVERMVRGLSPFTPEKNHIHHLLLETGFNHKKACNTLYTANVILILYAACIQNFLSITASLITIKIFGVILFEICTIKNIIYNRTMRFHYRYRLDDVKSENALIK